MMTRDLWTAKGPTATALKALERLGQRRQTLEAVTDADEDEAIVIARALATLDDMEECLCEEGHRAPRLAEGWRALDQLEARLAKLQQAPSIPARGETTTLPFPGNRHPMNPLEQGAPITVITAIETIRAVARRAVEDPSPGCFSAPAGASGRLLARVAQLVTRLFASHATGGAIRIVAQALAAFLPLLDRGRQPDVPRQQPTAEPELTTKDEARIEALLQEREARARERRGAEVDVATGRARPDRPPESPAAATTEPAIAPPAGAPPAAVSSDDDVWNDLLDLTSEALETFIRFRNAVGVERCLDLLNLLAEAFGIDRPEAA